MARHRSGSARHRRPYKIPHTAGARRTTGHYEHPFVRTAGTVVEVVEGLCSQHRDSYSYSYRWVRVLTVGDAALVVVAFRVLARPARSVGVGSAVLAVVLVTTELLLWGRRSIGAVEQHNTAEMSERRSLRV